MTTPFPELFSFFREKPWGRGWRSNRRLPTNLEIIFARQSPRSWAWKLHNRKRFLESFLSIYNPFDPIWFSRSSSRSLSFSERRYVEPFTALQPGRKKLGRRNAHTRSLVQLWCVVGLELVGLSALDPLPGQEKWRRLTGGRLGFIALYLWIAAIYN